MFQQWKSYCFLELKNHPFFDGIDWQKVAERQNDPPFEATELEIKAETPLDPVSLFGIGFDDEPKKFFVKKFQGKFPRSFLSALKN